MRAAAVELPRARRAAGERREAAASGSGRGEASSCVILPESGKKVPWPGLHRKYREPFTSPSFFPCNHAGGRQAGGDLGVRRAGRTTAHSPAARGPSRPRKLAGEDVPWAGRE